MSASAIYAMDWGSVPNWRAYAPDYLSRAAHSHHETPCAGWVRIAMQSFPLPGGTFGALREFLRNAHGRSGRSSAEWPPPEIHFAKDSRPRHAPTEPRMKFTAAWVPYSKSERFFIRADGPREYLSERRDSCMGKREIDRKFDEIVAFAEVA